ncbi:MAG: SURF1 family protein [Pseudomonadota bacterium]
MKGRFGIAVIGVLGVAALVALCVWQVQRLTWKEGVIAVLEQRLAGEPVALPVAFEPETQEFSRVRISGVFSGEPGAHGYPDAPLLMSLRPHGPGYRVIQPFDLTDGRRVMVDRGYAPVAEKNENGAAARLIPAPVETVELTGALRWPDEGGDGASFGARDNVWTARDLGVMAELFAAEPVLIVSETSTAVGDWPIPQPIAAINVPNNHLGYALTWGALAVIWAGMTSLMAYRVPRTS